MSCRGPRPLGRSGYLASFDVETTIRDAQILVPVILDLIEAPRVLVDVGGGIGIWCREFSARGVSRVVCIDHPVLTGELLIPKGEFIAVDLAHDLPDPIKADLVTCLEVAEHLPEQRSDALVSFLTECAAVVLFSAAMPGQGGAGHVNEQPPSYWDEKFQARNYYCCDLIRPLILGNKNISFWYRQNMIFYASDRGRMRLREVAGSAPDVPTDFLLVHESVFANVRKGQPAPTLTGISKEILPALRRAVRWRFGRWLK